MFQNVNKTREGDHHETVDHLIKASQSGCRICIYENLRREHHGTKEDDAISERPLLWYKFEVRKKENDEIYWEISFKSGASWAQNDLPDSIYGNFNIIWIHVDMADIIHIPHKYRSMLKLAKKDLKEKPWHVRRDDFHIREISSNTGNDATIKVAEDWLRECKENHKSCENVYGNTRSDWYPKRLVVVGEDDSKIRLVVPTQEHITGGYAALSHCWGRNSSFLT